eukprot:sb/3475239/
MWWHILIARGTPEWVMVVYAVSKVKSRSKKSKTKIQAFFKNAHRFKLANAASPVLRHAHRNKAALFNVLKNSGSNSAWNFEIDKISKTRCALRRANQKMTPRTPPFSPLNVVDLEKSDTLLIIDGVKF